MDVGEVIRRRRNELGLSQGQLAEAAGLSARQIGRYEAGDQQPVLSVAVDIAKALNITLTELAGQELSQRLSFTGDWWCCWQSWKDGEEVINAHQVRLEQAGELIRIEATTRGTEVARGGYMWKGELRLWDNEILMGWYVASEAAVRSKGTMYFTVHQHGQTAAGRWVGLSYDGKVITGWGCMGKAEDEVLALMEQLKTGASP